MHRFLHFQRPQHYPGACQPAKRDALAPGACAFQSRDRGYCLVVSWSESPQDRKPFTQPLLWKSSVRLLITAGEFNEMHILVLLLRISSKENIINLLADYSWFGIYDLFLQCFKLSTGFFKIWKKISLPIPAILDSEKNWNFASHYTLHVISTSYYVFFFLSDQRTKNH